MKKNHTIVQSQMETDLTALPQRTPLPTVEDFSALYALYSNPIFRYCHARCRDRELGQDLMQETFLRFWMCLQSTEEIRLPRALLYRIAYNLIIDHVRRKKTDSLDLLMETGFEPSVDLWHNTYSRLDAEKPLEKLRTLEKPYQHVLHCRFMLGLHPAEIATMTGETANTVSVRIFRGLERLRVLLAA